MTLVEMLEEADEVVEHCGALPALVASDCHVLELDVIQDFSSTPL